GTAGRNPARCARHRGVSRSWRGRGRAPRVERAGCRPGGVGGMTILELNDVHAYYGKIHALKGVSLTVDKGEIVTLIGGNGAGKTTTLRTICGLMRPSVGAVTFEGENLTRYKPSDLAARGIAMVPEGRGVFSRMTVLENLE